MTPGPDDKGPVLLAAPGDAGDGSGDWHPADDDNEDRTLAVAPTFDPEDAPPPPVAASPAPPRAAPGRPALPAASPRLPLPSSAGPRPPLPSTAGRPPLPSSAGPRPPAPSTAGAPSRPQSSGARPPLPSSAGGVPPRPLSVPPRPASIPRPSPSVPPRPGPVASSEPPGAALSDFPAQQDDGPTMAAALPEEMMAQLMSPEAAADMFGPPMRANAQGVPVIGSDDDGEEEATRALSRDEIAASLDSEAREILGGHGSPQAPPVQRPGTAPGAFQPAPPSVVVGDDGFGDEATIAAVIPGSSPNPLDVPPIPAAPTNRGPGAGLPHGGFAPTQESPKYQDPLAFPAPAAHEGGWAAGPAMPQGPPPEPPAWGAPPPAVPPSQPEQPFNPDFAAFLAGPAPQGAPPPHASPPMGMPPQHAPDGFGGMQPPPPPGPDGFGGMPGPPPPGPDGFGAPAFPAPHQPHQGGYPMPPPGPDPQFGGFGQPPPPQLGPPQGQNPWGQAPMQAPAPSGGEPSTQLLVLVALGAFFAVLLLAVGGYFILRGM